MIKTLLGMSIIITLLVPFATAAYDWTQTEEAVQKAINAGIFSGCILGVATDNATLFKKAFGTLGPKRGFYSPPVTADMKFDLGSLTEPIGINAVLMDMYDKGLIKTTNRIAFLYNDFNNNGKGFITVQNLLEHNSGLQATYNGTLPNTPAELITAINKLKLQKKTEYQFEYSELGPIVLGQVISKMTKKTLPQAMFDILTIMGMRDTVYIPKTDRLKIAPGGYTDRIAWGTPFNRLAHFLNDNAGNAGLFSTIADVITYMQLLLNKGKNPMYFRVFSEEVVGKFLNVTRYSRYNNTRALGWETVPKDGCPCGTKFSASPDSFGLSDFDSGSYVWADKKRNVTIVLLANGAFPGGTTMNPTAYQSGISDAIMTALGH